MGRLSLKGGKRLVDWREQAEPDLSRRRANEFRRGAPTWSAGALRGQRYFDGLGISILLTLMESPFSSPVRLTA
jgi:hypothetical protein